MKNNEEKLIDEEIEYLDIPLKHNTDDSDIEVLELYVDSKIDDPKTKNKAKVKNKRFTKTFITFIVLDILVFLGFFITYGPVPYFRNLLVTSAMETMSHKYLARVFYSDSMIVKIMSNNKTIENNDNTNADDIEFGDIEEKEIYESIYEEQILKKDKDNDLYKIIEVSGSNYKGHLIAIYDASRINLIQSRYIKYGGQQLDDMAKDNEALIAINASGFANHNPELMPLGAVIIDGKVVADNGSTGWGGGLVGFNNDNVLILTKDSPHKAVRDGMRDAMSFGPFLIVNGVPSKFSGNGGYGLAPRTAIAQRKDGIVLFLVIDGRRPGHSIGIDMVEMTKLFLKYGAYNASNLDGGGSSTLVVNNEIINIAGGYGYDGDRFLPNSWMLK